MLMDEQKTADIISLYNSGLSVGSVASRSRCSEVTALRVLIENGLMNDKMREWTERPGICWDKVLGMYNRGESVQSMAQQLGIARHTLQKYMLTHGMPIRGRSESMYLRMGKLTSIERLALTDAAHAGNRGRRKDAEFLRKRAKAVETVCQLSKTEQYCIDHLVDRQVGAVALFAVDKFNIDIAVPESMLAIEVHNQWHTEERKASQDNKKLQHLQCRGWFVVYVHTQYNCDRQLDFIVHLSVMRKTYLRLQ